MITFAPWQMFKSGLFGTTEHTMQMHYGYGGCGAKVNINH